MTWALWALAVWLLLSLCAGIAVIRWAQQRRRAERAWRGMFSHPEEFTDA